MRRLVWAIVCVCCLTACLPDRADHAVFTAIDPEGWVYGDTLALTPEIDDSVAEGRIVVAVRHTDGYIYRNLWLEMSVPQGDTVIADTLNISLADIYGKWYGTGMGVSYMASDTLPGRYRLMRGQPVALRHIMRSDTLHDIEQIGLVFIPD